MSTYVDLPLPNFEGTEREDPRQYIDDVILYSEASDYENSDPQQREIHLQTMRYVFFRGLEGSAKEWYLQLPAEKRKSWADLQQGLTQRFPLRTDYKHIAHEARIDSFTRQKDEDLAQYIGRAIQLSYGASDAQLNKLKERLYEHVRRGNRPEDKKIMAQVTDILLSRGLVNNLNQLKSTCTCFDIIEDLVGCAISSMEPEKIAEFLGRMEIYSHDPSKKSIREEILCGFTDAFTDAQKVFAAECQSTPQVAVPSVPHQPSQLHNGQSNDMTYTPGTNDRLHTGKPSSKPPRSTQNVQAIIKKEPDLRTPEMEQEVIALQNKLGKTKSEFSRELKSQAHAFQAEIDCLTLQLTKEKLNNQALQYRNKIDSLFEASGMK